MARFADIKIPRRVLLAPLLIFLAAGTVSAAGIGDYEQQQLVRARPWYRAPVLEKFDKHNLHLLDRFVAGVVREDKVRAQLVGSTHSDAIAALSRGTRPRGNDVDLRITGLSVHQVIALAKRTIPNLIDCDITFKPPFKKGVQHVQIAVNDMQLDLGVYTHAAFDRPHQHLTIAQLALDISPHQPLTKQLVAISSEAGVRAALASGVIKDPSGKGLDDLLSGKLRYHRLPGVPAESINEAFLHVLYWIGNPGRWEIAEETLQQFKSINRETLFEYFNHKRLAPRRVGYLLNAFRTNKKSRLPIRVLRNYAQLGVLGMVFPGMNEVSNDPVRWRNTLRAYGHAFRFVRNQKTKTGRERRTREWILGAALSELDSKQFEAVLGRFPAIHRTTSNQDRLNVKARIRNAYRFYHHQDLSPSNLMKLKHRGDSAMIANRPGRRRR